MPQSQVDPFTAVAEGQRQDVYAALARSGRMHQITTPTGEPAWLLTGHPNLLMHGLTALPVALHPVDERNPT